MEHNKLIDIRLDEMIGIKGFNKMNELINFRDVWDIKGQLKPGIKS